MDEKPRYSFTQPICAKCWSKRQPDREPVTITRPADEKCAHCGRQTRAGIYIRVDPSTVQFPTVLKDS